jgi:hypothetical protein
MLMLLQLRFVLTRAARYMCCLQRAASAAAAAVSTPFIAAGVATTSCASAAAAVATPMCLHACLLSRSRRHPNDELNYCYYLIPCGKPGYCGDVTESDLAKLHNDAITRVSMQGQQHACVGAHLALYAA